MSGSAFGHEFALIKKDHLVTVLDDTAHIMGYHQDCGSLFAYLLHPAVAFGLEKNIAHGQCLIHNQDFRVHVDG